MSNFRIGQEVVALTDPVSHMSQPRQKGKIYPVLDVIYCPKTGEQSINIAGHLEEGRKDNYRCTCGERHPNNGKYWTAAIFFAPLQTDAEEADMNEALQEVFERELFQVNN